MKTEKKYVIPESVFTYPEFIGFSDLLDQARYDSVKLTEQ
jgi:hypothetical protein